MIAETVSKLAYKIPSLHGKGIHTIWDTGLGGIYKPFLVDFLKNRHEQINRNPSDAVKDRLTQSGCWYRERPKMIAEGFKPRNKYDCRAKYTIGIQLERASQAVLIKS